MRPQPTGLTTWPGPQSLRLGIRYREQSLRLITPIPILTINKKSEQALRSSVFDKRLSNKSVSLFTLECVSSRVCILGVGKSQRLSTAPAAQSWPGLKDLSLQSLRLYTKLQYPVSATYYIPVKIGSNREYIEASAVNQLASWLAFLNYLVVRDSRSVLSM